MFHPFINEQLLRTAVVMVAELQQEHPIRERGTSRLTFCVARQSFIFE